MFDDDAAVQVAAVEELWSATMTWTDLGNNWFGGFADAFSTPTWSEDGRDFRIWFISYDVGAREFSMSHDGTGGVIAEPGQLTLHVGGLTVEPGQALSTFARAGYATLSDVDSQWRVGEQVTVRLTRTSDEAAPAPVGPGLSVADAQVNEASGAPLRFRVTAAAHGDLSSEKVYARLRTMTCAGREPGTVVESEVAGFIAGSGKTGVRGPVVSREGALVEKTFRAGLVSGVGQGVGEMPREASDKGTEIATAEADKDGPSTSPQKENEPLAPGRSRLGPDLGL